MGDLIELTTTPQYEVDFYKITSGMKFYLKGKGCASIRLVFNPNDNLATWIMIGNDYSWIVNEKQVETKNMISEHTYKPFWISWYQNKIKVGEGNNPKPFLVGKDYINRNYIDIVFSSSETMFWKFRLPHVVKPHKYKRISGGQLKWVKMEGNCLPEDALIGGYENEVLYIMRAMHEEALTPGKFMPSKGAGYVAWGCDALTDPMEIDENTKVANISYETDMEVLCGYNCVWLRTIDHKIPEGAVEGGYSEVEHETLYVGRAMFDGHLIPGRVQPSHKNCCIAYEEETLSRLSYEILVGLNRSILCGYHGIWAPSEGDRIPAGAFIGGYTEYHETMFVGRAIHNNIIIPGKIAPSHKVCYMAYAGKTVSNFNYEVLIVPNTGTKEIL